MAANLLPNYFKCIGVRLEPAAHLHSSSSRCSHKMRNG
uniref:Uncharacterized protein n=1 Tax=Arundo donax TaxID=35708 RepID=A0A0A9AV68_ARUDO